MCVMQEKRNAERELVRRFWKTCISVVHCKPMVRDDYPHVIRVRDQSRGVQVDARGATYAAGRGQADGRLYS